MYKQDEVLDTNNVTCATIFTEMYPQISDQCI